MHGDSPAPRTSILHFAAAVSAVVESLGPARLLVGHSAGGAHLLALQNEPLSPWGTLAGVMKNRPGGLDAAGVALLGAPADPAALFGTFLRGLGVGERLHRSIAPMSSNGTDLVGQPEHSAAGLFAPDTGSGHSRSRRPRGPFADAERIVREWPDAKLVATVGLGHQRILRDDRVVQHVVDFARALGG